MNKHWNLNANIIQKVYNTFKQHVVILVTLQCIGVCTKVKNLSDMHIRGFLFNSVFYTFYTFICFFKNETIGHWVPTFFIIKCLQFTLSVQIFRWSKNTRLSFNNPGLWGIHRMPKLKEFFNSTVGSLRLSHSSIFIHMDKHLTSTWDIFWIKSANDTFIAF